jgi:hypothetical protein
LSAKRTLAWLGKVSSHRFLQSISVQRNEAPATQLVVANGCDFAVLGRGAYAAHECHGERYTAKVKLETFIPDNERERTIQWSFHHLLLMMMRPW